MLPSSVYPLVQYFLVFVPRGQTDTPPTLTHPLGQVVLVEAGFLSVLPQEPPWRREYPDGHLVVAFSVSVLTQAEPRMMYPTAHP